MAKDNENHDSQGDGRFDFGGFLGFENPTTTPTPDLLFDKIMQDLNESELKVLLYIIRRTFGFKKKTDNISLSQLVDGIKTKAGRTLDRGTGLSKSSVKRALQSLKKKNLLNAQKNIDPKRGNLPTTYSLRMLETPRPATEPRVGSPVDLGLAHQRTPQQTVKQQTDSVVVKELTARGITPKIAGDLAKEYPSEHITQKIELLDYLLEIKSPLVKRNPAGYLLKAITEDYSPPKGFKTKDEREAEAAEGKRQHRLLEEEKQTEREQEQDFYNRVIETYQIPANLIGVWDKVLEHLSLDLPQGTFDKWFKNTFLLSKENGVVTVGVDSPESYEWLTARVQSTLARMLTGHFGEEVSVRFEVFRL